MSSIARYWLRNKEYCIFNKQFSKEEYERLVPLIIEHMAETFLPDSKEHTEWGEFFPPSLSPFAYNETIAQDYFPLTNETKGEYSWLNEKNKIINSEHKVEIADNILDIDETIFKSLLKCEDTGKMFKIIPQELEFYNKHSIPLPRKHPERRLEIRLNNRPPRNIHYKKCSKCEKSILTIYDQDSYEQVLCSSCYRKHYYT